MTPRLARTWALIAALALAAPAAHASIEEFESFDVVRQELDDESLLDHRLTRAPRDRGRAPGSRRNTLSTSQGCLTSDRWFVLHQLDLEAPMGERARFALTLDQQDSDALAYQHLDFAFRFRSPFGWPGFMVRPLAVKARQDFGLTWRFGEDTLDARLDLRFVFEDTFNSFWVFRQTQVGEGAQTERYDVHPYEPGADVAVRRGLLRLTARGHALSPSRRTLAAPLTTPIVRELWGAYAAARVESDPLHTVVGDLAWSLSAEGRQARGAERVEGGANQRTFRRQWSGTADATTWLNGEVSLTAAFTYAARHQHFDEEGTTLGHFEALDRTTQLELEWRTHDILALRFGALSDRIGVSRTGAYAGVGYGTRTESRAYVGATARFGQVTVSAVEGFELDDEPYDVWGLHDKGFVQLTATF